MVASHSSMLDAPCGHSWHDAALMQASRPGDEFAFQPVLFRSPKAISPRYTTFASSLFGSDRGPAFPLIVVLPLPLGYSLPATEAINQRLDAVAEGPPTANSAGMDGNPDL